MEAKTQIEAGDAELQQKSLSWAFGTGYINVWNRMHRAEEALLFLVPVEEAIEGGLIDDLRLGDSGIAESNALRHQLRMALKTLDHDASAFFENKQPNPSLNAERTSQEVAQEAKQEPPLSPPDREMRARAVLSGVRAAINMFRDDRRDGLVRARTNLLATIIFTGVVTYLLVILTIALKIGSPYVVAALAYYLVGTIVGLFGRLYDQAQEDNVVEDYGLGNARLLLTPPLSGLAAIGGVVLLAMLPASMAPVAANSTQTGAAGPAAVAALQDIFDLQRYQFGLLIAAVFGLTPRLLIDRLRQESDRYAADLSASGVATKPFVQGASAPRGRRGPGAP